MIRTPLIPLLAVTLLAGCGGENSDRAGGHKPPKPRVLTMANANEAPGELEAFQQAVARLSGGRLRIEFRNEYTKGRTGNAEVSLIRDVIDGKTDLGWAGTRVFDTLGDDAFNPLNAPMLVNSYDLQEKVVDDDLVQPMLASLDELELHGIGVLPGPLRRPLGKHPLRASADWAGARIAFSGGGQNNVALHALGATTVYDHPNITEATDDLDGIETHVSAIPGNHYHRTMPYLTGNVVLWPRALVVFAAPKVGADDLAVLRKAAKAAIPATVALERSQENEQMSGMCQAGLKVVTAGESDMSGLRAAFQPIYDKLGNDAAASRAISRIRELATDTSTNVSAPRCAQDASPAKAAAIPPGTYRTTITRADAKAFRWSWAHVVEGDPDPKALKARTRSSELVFTQDGQFLVKDIWLDHSTHIGWEGSYSVYRDRIKVEGNDGDGLTARLRVDGNRLRFTDIEPDAYGPVALAWGAKPYVKVD
jgi:TRAP-type C4-dicarboxylate transport system substrate-binding protein